MGRLSHLNERDRKLVEQFGETLVHRLLHGPTSQLKHMASGERGAEMAGALRYLFRLDEQEGGPKPPDSAAPTHERGAPTGSAAQPEDPPAGGNAT